MFVLVLENVKYFIVNIEYVYVAQQCSILLHVQRVYLECFPTKYNKVINRPTL